MSRRQHRALMNWHRVLECGAICTAHLAMPNAFAEDSDVIAEIVVTAQKRAENVQEVPISISVLAGTQIEQLHATSITDYAAYVPGLTVFDGGSPGKVQISMRGLNPLTSSAMVGTVVDETPLGSSGGWAQESTLSFDMMPYDLDHLEVLKGPQGTLYGANSMGGLLKYVTKAPSLNAFEGRAGAQLSDVHGSSETGTEGRAAINIPLIEDTLGVRASFYKASRPGFVDNPVRAKNDVNSADQDGGRLALLWRMSPALDLKLSAMSQRIQSDSNDAIWFGVSDTTPDPIVDGVRAIDGGFVPAAPISGDLTQRYLAAEPFRKRVHVINGTLNAHLDSFEIVSASSYSRSRTHGLVDLSHAFAYLIPYFSNPAVETGITPFDLRLHLRRFTQELRISSSQPGKFEWLAGAYYSDEKVANEQSVYALTLDRAPLFDVVTASTPTTYEEHALFGNATYRFNERFDVTAGLRYAHNKQRFRQILGGNPDIIGPPSDTPGRSSESVVTYAFSPRLHINDDVMAYARVATGYRPGWPNSALPGVPPALKADRTTNYELGLKAELMARTLLLDLAVYRIDWRKIQLETTNADGISFDINGGKARSKGLELTTAWQPTRGLRLTGNLAYTDAELRQRVDSGFEGFWESGDVLPSAPKWTSSFTGNYTHALGPHWTADLGIGVRHVGANFTKPPSDFFAVKLAEYSAVDLNVGISSDHWSLQLFARNLLDKRAYGFGEYGVGTDVSFQPTIDFVALNPIQPRTIGVSLDVIF